MSLIPRVLGPSLGTCLQENSFLLFLLFFNVVRRVGPNLYSDLWKLRQILDLATNVLISPMTVYKRLCMCLEETNSLIRFNSMYIILLWREEAARLQVKRGRKRSCDSKDGISKDCPNVPKTSDSADLDANNRCYQLATLSRHKISRKRLWQTIIVALENEQLERGKNEPVFVDQVYRPFSFLLFTSYLFP